ncbi:MAG: VOC family protein [Actinomycetota bacterium]
MNVGHVVLYVEDAEACLRFWTDAVGMIEKSRMMAGDFPIVKVGFADQNFAFELVPLALMRDNPDGVHLAKPSIAFHVDNLEATHSALVAKGVQASEVGEHSGVGSFAFADNKNRWFAMTRG